MRLFLLLLLSSLSASSLATTCFDQISLSVWHAVASTPRKSSSKHGCAINAYFDKRANETVFVDMLVRHKASKDECVATTLHPVNETTSATYPVYMVSCRCSGALCNNVNLVLDSLRGEKLPKELLMMQHNLEDVISHIKRDAKETFRNMMIFAGVVSITLAVAVTANTVGMAAVLVKNYAG